MKGILLMRFNQLMLIFIIVFAGVAIPIFLNTNISAKSAQLNNEYANNLITATEGAIASVTEKGEYSYVFASEQNRQKAVNTFYEILIKCFNYDFTTYQELVKYYVPCVFLIDTDGYYIEYTSEYTDSSGIICYEEVITPINKWAKDYSIGGNGLTGETCQVEFHLDDTISVTYKNSKDEMVTVSGLYSEVYYKLTNQSDGALSPNLISILSSDKSFQTEKRDVIINILNNQMEYYINVYDESINQKNNVQYQFTLPQITGEDWARLIDQPTVVSFLQGLQTPYDTTYLNVYSFAGAEIEKEKKYYIAESGEGISCYHEADCPYLSEENKQSSYSMEEAAKHGAYPCSECIH